jgi:hypothetical protein
MWAREMGLMTLSLLVSIGLTWWEAWIGAGRGVGGCEIRFREWAVVIFPNTLVSVLNRGESVCELKHAR